jgi:hypothetical protein
MAINELRRHKELRDRYQIWIYTYPTLAPIPYNCVKFRDSLLELRKKLDPELDDPATNHMVLVSHSLGGLLIKHATQTSGNRIWNCITDKPLDELDVSEEDRSTLRHYAFFETLTFVDRLVFLSAPHGGSEDADGFLANFGRLLIDQPHELDDLYLRVRAKNREALKGDLSNRLSTGLDTLSPKNGVLRELNQLPIPESVPFHTIVGTEDDRVARQSSIARRCEQILVELAEGEKSM